MFYKDVTLFGSQSVVDRLVDDIAATMNLSRSDLWVVSLLLSSCDIASPSVGKRASAKGLFCGSALTLRMKSGDVIGGMRSEV